VLGTFTQGFTPMNLLVAILLFVYLMMAQHLFKLWLKFFQQDTSVSSEERSLSWVTLLVGAVFWPIVVPISYTTLLEKKLDSKKVTCRC
jgi:small-conductance mechanosensitive channel